VFNRHKLATVPFAGFLLRAITVSLVVICTVYGSWQEAMGDEMGDVIATVGGEEIRFSVVSPGRPLDPSEWSASYRKTLSHRVIALARQIIVKKALESVAIEEDSKAIGDDAQKMADAMWGDMGTTKEERELRLKRVRAQIQKVKRAVQLWREHPAKGDRYAESELKPLGVGEKVWEFLKKRARSDPDKLASSLEYGATISRKNLPRQFEDLVAQKRKLQRFKEDLLEDMEVAPAVTERFGTLVNEVKRIRLEIYEGSLAEPQKIGEGRVEDGEVPVAGALVLGSSALRRGAGDICAFYAAMIAVEFGQLGTGAWTEPTWGTGVQLKPQKIKIQEMVKVAKGEGERDFSGDGCECVRAYLKAKKFNEWLVQKVQEELELEGQWKALRDFVLAEWAS